MPRTLTRLQAAHSPGKEYEIEIEYFFRPMILIHHPPGYKRVRCTLYSTLGSSSGWLV